MGIAVRAPTGSTFLIQLDQLAGNQRLNTSGFAESLPHWTASRDALKSEAESTATTQPAARWIMWFVADHLHRTTSPFSKLTVAEWISNRLEQNSVGGTEGMRAVWEVDPNDARCLARLAIRMIQQIPAEYQAGVSIYVELYSRRAVELAPQDPDVLWRRSAMLAWLGRRAEAERLADRCRAPAADDLWAWEAKWEAAVFLRRDADAQAALATAEDLAKSKSKFIRDSLKRNVEEVRALLVPPAATRKAETRPGN